MASERPESSRAREEAAEREAATAEEEARQQPRSWVALASIVVVCDSKHERAAEVAPGVADFLLELQDPPRGSYLLVPEHLAPDPRMRSPFDNFAYIIAAVPDRLLFLATDRAQRRGGLDPVYFLCDVGAGTATRLPAVHREVPIKLFPRRTMGLVADPRFPGHHMVVQLHPAEGADMRRHDALLCFSTATGQWTVKTLTSAPNHEPWGAHGVFAHGRFLCWVDIAYGMLTCDPFEDHPDLRFVPLPPGSEMQGLGGGQRPTRLMDQRRCIRPSQGTLCYVEIQGLSYDRATLYDPPINPSVSVWTLGNLASLNPWNFECDAPFADIWAHPAYISSGLPQGKVPNLALIDPNNHDVVYFFQDASILAVNVRTRVVVACEEYWDAQFQDSRFVDAWVLEQPPTSPASSEGGSQMKGSDGEEELDAAKGSDEELASLFGQLEIKSQPDMELSSSQLLSMLVGEDMETPSEPSLEAEAGDQADEP
nr:unnamed protein product [Digitaria exilis]